MSYVHFSFATPAFKDQPEIKAQNVNEIAGHALATWLSQAIRARGFETSEIWPEDHGWDFSVSKGNSKFNCSCSINDDEEPMGDAHVTLGSKATPDHEIVVAVEELLRQSEHVKDLELDTHR